MGWIVAAIICYNISHPVYGTLFVLIGSYDLIPKIYRFFWG
jgi:hypothetical protein